jgi:hypothetical protein
MRAFRRLFAWSDSAVLDRWRRVVAYGEIAGLFLAVVVTLAERLPAAAGLATARTPAETFALLFLGALSAIAGWQLLQRRLRGVVLSALVLLPQAVWLYLPTASYRFVAGLALLPSWTTGFGWDITIGAAATLRWHTSEPRVGTGVGVNFWVPLALGVLVLVGRQYRARTVPADAPVSEGANPVAAGSDVAALPSASTPTHDEVRG